MEKIIVGILIVVAIIAGALYLRKSGSNDPAVQGKTEVAYTDSGFSPKEMNISAGETVTWINKSTKKMWVASAPHPAHTDYPEFDAKKGVDPGGSYSFTFEKPGNWKYHNHTNPTDFGSVNVAQ